MEETSTKPSRDPNKCYGDGFCWVYEQTDPPEGSSQECGYARSKNTQWCKCTREMCLVPCPNHFVCGNVEYPKAVMACHNMRCTNCNIIIGRNLELMTKASLPQEWECPVCMEKKDDACVFPDCPAKHHFCLGCMKGFLWGVPNPAFESYEGDSDSEFPFHGSTNSCPMCRHKFDPSDGWSKNKRKV